MTYVRKLPSGKWQATIRLPDGSRRTHTTPLKGQATTWGADEEAKLRRGEWHDPKNGRVMYDAWRQRWWQARVVEESTRRSDASSLRLHVDPFFTGRPLPSIGRMDVQGWVRQLEQNGIKPFAIQRAYNLLTSLMGTAVLEGILVATPCRKIDRPPTPAKSPQWFTVEQIRAIVAELPKGHGIATLLMVWTGLRWGEMAGLRIKDVDWDRRTLNVIGVRTQLGIWKAYPKSGKSRREVPVPGVVLTMLRELAGDRPQASSMFVTVRGARPLTGGNWRRTWDTALEAAGVPNYSPHTCRHTAASWLVQDGVALYDVQELLGHESHQTTMRYAHLAPDAHSAVTDSWARIEANTVVRDAEEILDAQLTHEAISAEE